MKWIFAVMTLACAGALAQAVAPEPPPEGGAVKYLSGGAGEEERKQLDAQADQFPLQILFSAQGAYTVADTVVVNNRQGPVLTVRNAGPLLMVNLPPGAYVVKASFGAATQERVVSVAGRPQKIDWAAPAP